MKTVREEIEEKFANVSYGCISPILLMPESAPAWAIRQVDGSFGVTIPYTGEPVYEEFSGACLCSVNENRLGHGLPGMLMLLSTDENRRNEFSLLCADFIEPGAENWKRKSLTARPLAWWEGWRDLLGNTVRHMKPHAVLGELLVYEYLLNQNGGSVSWTGPRGASHDLQCVGMDVEVKSSLQRYESIVEITGQFQLRDDTDLWLYFCRLEPSKNGVCVNDLVRTLTRYREIQRDDLNAKLAALGYAEGNSARRDRFTVLELRRYPVDAHFPRILPQSFVGGAVPPGIRRISYAVDLGMLPGETVRLAPKYYKILTQDSHV